MRRLRRCKILATLGPASADKATIAALHDAGADLFRINMSHADHDGMRERIAMIREVEQESGRPIGILVDLQGPKLRIGTFHDGAVMLKKGAEFTLDADPTPGDIHRVHLPHPEILSALEPGHIVLIDDGKVRLHVIEATPQSARAVVDVAGRISNRKGVSLPNTEIPVSAMTPKDRSDLEAGLN
ncbi:MAG: pyruvate kinase, partial [Hyphomicrobiales bacterium]|nr:pyruvate kinase [Hyphomicrobiales bacterium]